MKVLAQIWLKRKDRVDYFLHEEVIDNTLEAKKQFLKGYTYDEDCLELNNFKILSNDSVFEVKFLTEDDVVRNSHNRNMTKQEKIYYRSAIHHLFN